MADTNKEKRTLASGILDTIGGLGSLVDLAYPGVGTGIRMGTQGIEKIVDYSLPDEAGAPPAGPSVATPAQLETPPPAMLAATAPPPAPPSMPAPTAPQPAAQPAAPLAGLAELLGAGTEKSRARRFDAPMFGSSDFDVDEEA